VGAHGFRPLVAEHLAPVAASKNPPS
jgi:hypothetical protein